LVVEGLHTYRHVNVKFAQAVAEHYREGDVVWVHDYQLMLVPKLLRELIPNARIGFFLHIPFPALETFSALPGRDEILEGVLGADLIGFHAQGYADNFMAAIRSLLRVDASEGTVSYEDRTIQFGAFPMGIDAQEWQTQAR